MDSKQLEKLLKKIDMDSGIKVPSGLSAKISQNVAVRAQVLERRKVMFSVLKLAAAVLLGLYGITAAIVSLMKSSISDYIATFFDSPSAFFESNGMQAVLERLPFLSVLIALFAGIYVIRHIFIKGAARNPYVFATAMSALGVVVMTGMFVAGMAIGVNSSEDVQTVAGTALFEPLLQNASDSDYSLVGEVIAVGDVRDGKQRIVLQLADNEKRSIVVPEEMLNEQLGRSAKTGDRLLIFGKPEVANENSMPSNLKDNSEKAPIEASYVRVLLN